MVKVLTGLIIFGVAFTALMALMARFAVDSTDGRDWIERHSQ